jgi:hypothetical protein
MNILGSVGQIYMFILLILLFLGSGFALWSLINSAINKKKQKPEAMNKKLNLESKSNKNNIIEKMIGGFEMNNNGWLKLAVFSFVGILVSVVILGFVSTTYSQGTNIHQQHQQQGTGNMNMGNMNMGGMSNGTMQNNNMAIQQQLNQMQMQLNQMQQQMGMMNGGMGGMNNMGSMGGSQMQQGMGNMGGMGMMGGMMNMGNMSGSGSMQNNNSSSMSGMSMM